ncbi:hypothetical protein ACA910_000969 [Epithemia clementina (nom. ined.)]
MKFVVPLQHIACTTFWIAFGWGVDAFVTIRPEHQAMKSSMLKAKPKRLNENVAGVVYVNDRCINCAACSNFAPSTFSMAESIGYHVVHKQPSTQEEIQKARSALAACPVAAIRLETLAERRHLAQSEQDKEQVEKSWTEEDEQLVRKMQLRSESPAPFPRRFLDDDSLKDDVYWLGHHNDRSFGATPYLFRTRNKEGEDIWIMIDTPKFSLAAARDIEELTGHAGPDYLFLTHVDDTADHDKWARFWNDERKGDLKRIFHSLELGNNWLGDNTLKDVEILLPKAGDPQQNGLTAYNLNGEVLPINWQESNVDNVAILHTPGHSPGSITLYRRPGRSSDDPGILFTGDTYGWTPRSGGKMTAFPRYGNNLKMQAETLQKLLHLDWKIIAPGHGHPRDYREEQNYRLSREEEMQVALGDMVAARRR